MTIQKLIYTTPIKARIQICNQFDSRLNPYSQYFLEFEDGNKIKAYPTDKFAMWLKRNELDPNTYYIFKGQFRTVRDVAYESDSLVCNPLLGIELEDQTNIVSNEFTVPIRIFQVYKNQEKYNTPNFILGSVKSLLVQPRNVSYRRQEFPIKLCFNKNTLETKYPDFQLVSKEGWATVIRDKYNLFMVDFEELGENKK